MTSQTTPFPFRNHGKLVTALLVAAFWILTAVLMLSSRAGLGARWPAAAAMATITAPIVAAYAYSRLVAREAGTTHALGVGIAWLTFSIATEIATIDQAGPNVFSLLGPPDQPLVRNLLLFVWVFSPILFTRRHYELGQQSPANRAIPKESIKIRSFNEMAR